MTQEDKELLLKDLATRLPYGVKIDVNGEKDTLLELGVDTGWVNASYDIDDVKPYLRSKSNMTEKEMEEYYQHIVLINGVEKYDWLNAHNFDYRGLIERDLAIEVDKDFYK